MNKDDEDPPSAEEKMSRLIVRSGSGSGSDSEDPARLPEERSSSRRFRRRRPPRWPRSLLLLALVGVLAAAALVSSSRRIRGEGQHQQQSQQQQSQQQQPRGLRWWRRWNHVDDEDRPSVPRNATGADASQDEGVNSEDEPASVDLTAKGACRDAVFFPSSSSSSSHTFTTSFRSVWLTALRKRVRDAALDYVRQRAPRTVNLTAFENWLDGVVIPFHTFERLQRSVAYPASDAPILRLLEILQRRRVDPTQHPPVRVLVMGGSVVEGVTCTANQVGLPVLGRLRLDHTCPWPGRLGRMLNEALFPMDDESQQGLPAASSSHPLFEIHNAAKGGTNSRIGSMLLEYQLLPWARSNVPDVIVLAYSANDAQDPDPHDTFQQHVPTLVRAAHNVRPCDVDLPLVIMVDDLYGHGGLVGATALGQTGSLYKAASWYGLMAISYANVGRNQAVAAYYNATSVNPLHGSHLDIHLGMGYHISMALTLLFNVAAAMHNTCESIFWGGGNDVPSPSTADSEEEARRIDVLDEPHSKDRGRFHGSIEEVRREWEANVRERERLCTRGESNLSSATEIPSVERPGHPTRQWSQHTTAACEYAWLVNPASGVYSANSLTAAMESVLSYNDGWGVPETRPRHLGWEIVDINRGGNTTTNNNSSSSSTIHRFELMLANVTVPTKYLTVVSMRSYSEHWVGSRVKVSVQVTNDKGSIHGDTATISSAPATTAVWEVSGYHDTLTSVFVPNKFEIPGSGADVGDTIVINFELVGGRAFKIGGLALCRR